MVLIEDVRFIVRVMFKILVTVLVSDPTKALKRTSLSVEYITPCRVRDFL